MENSKEFPKIRINALIDRKAYKKMMGKYHPDRLEADGANQESIKAATEKTQAVKAAYERICEAKGI